MRLLITLSPLELNLELLFKTSTPAHVGNIYKVISLQGWTSTSLQSLLTNSRMSLHQLMALESIMCSKPLVRSLPHLMPLLAAWVAGNCGCIDSTRVTASGRAVVTGHACRGIPILMPQ